MRKSALWVLLGLAVVMFAAVGAGAQDKPNILVIMGDDVGYWNLSYNSGAMMGYKTPNIDRIAAEGVRFTDYYGAVLHRRAGRLHYRPDAGTYRPHQGGAAGRRPGHSQRGPDPGLPPAAKLQFQAKLQALSSEPGKR